MTSVFSSVTLNLFKNLSIKNGFSADWIKDFSIFLASSSQCLGSVEKKKNRMPIFETHSSLED